MLIPKPDDDDDGWLTRLPSPGGMGGSMYIWGNPFRLEEGLHLFLLCISPDSSALLMLGGLVIDRGLTFIPVIVDPKVLILVVQDFSDRVLFLLVQSSPLSRLLQHFLCAFLLDLHESLLLHQEIE